MSRRNLLKHAASAAAFGATTSYAGTCIARASESIVAIEWGGESINAMKEVVAKQSDVQINWQLHAGTSAATLAKIKAMWPNPGVDIVSGWDPNWATIAAEGWAEPVTVDKVPNIANISSKLLVKDKAGNVINIPRGISAEVWFCREDLMPFEISKLDDLLDPRLKGKICFPKADFGYGVALVSLALYKGGNERNMEPAWDFVKKLAASGNIGRIATSDVDISNSISSGETAISFGTGNSANNLSRDFKIRFLTKMDPKASGFWSYFYHDGWCVLKGGHTDAAFKLLNFIISPDVDAEYARLAGSMPANLNSKPLGGTNPLAFTADEMQRFAFVPDWAFLSQQSSDWGKRWEQEIQPLL